MRDQLCRQVVLAVVVVARGASGPSGIDRIANRRHVVEGVALFHVCHDIGQRTRTVPHAHFVDVTLVEVRVGRPCGLVGDRNAVVVESLRTKNDRAGHGGVAVVEDREVGHVRNRVLHEVD